MTKKESSILSFLHRTIGFLYVCLFAITPLLFYPKTSELFEFNKMLFVYLLTISLIVSWSLIIIIQKRFLFKRSFLDIPLGIFITSQALSTLFSIDSRISLLGYYSRWNGGLLSLLSYAVLYWGAVTFLHKVDMKKNILALMFSTAVSSLWGIGEHFGASASCLAITGKFDVACWVQEVSLRVYATFGQPNWMAAWISALIPLTWVTLSVNKGKNALPSKTGLLSIGATILFTLALLYTKSRSGILALGVSSLIFWGTTILFHFRDKSSRWVTPLVVSCAVLALLIALVGTPWTPQLFAEKEQLQAEKMTLPALETGGTESGDIRKIVWTGAIEVWKKYPLLGSGVETFALSYYQGRPMAHNLTSEWNFLYNKAHNEYLNFLATSGIVGLASYLLVIGTTVFFLVKERISNKTIDETSQTNLAILSGLVSIYITNFFGFSVVTTNILFFLLPAFVVVLTAEKQNRESTMETIDTWQWVSAGFVFLVGVYLVTRVGNYFLADLSYAQAIAQKADNDYSAALKSINQSVSRSNEPIFTDFRADLYATLAQVSDESKETKLTQTLIQRTLLDLESVKAASPVNVKLLKSRANILSDLVDVDQKNIPLLIDTLNQLALLAPTDPSVMYQRGLSYAKQGDMDKAIHDVEQAVSMKPNYKIARRLLALLYKEAKQIQKSKEQLLYILTNISPDDKTVQDELNAL